MAIIKRVVEQEGQFVVMVEGDELPVANELNTVNEAETIAMLISLGPYQDKRVYTAFRPDDEDEIVPDTGTFFFNGEEYQRTEDMGELADALFYFARHAVAERYNAENKQVPQGLWRNDPATDDECRRWLIELASKHEVLSLLPDRVTEQVPDTSPDSGDRYHLSLLADLVRNPDAHDLDPSEKKGIIETLDRLRERAGLDI